MSNHVVDIKPMHFDGFRVFEMDLAGRPLRVETGKMAGLANGACLIRYGETAVLTTATMSAKPRDGIDFFPLSVDFEEKLYSVGKIPGSFLRREGRPGEKAILASRVIDRPIRPLFPKDMRNDVCICNTVMSVDPDCSPEIAAMIGTSVAITISDIPWFGPISGVSIGLIDGQFIVNPTAAQREKTQLTLTVASSEKKVVMIEAGANQVDEETMYNAIMLGHQENKRVCAFIQEIRDAIGKPKQGYPVVEVDHDMYDAIAAFATDGMKYAMDTDDKVVREERLAELNTKVHEAFDEKYPEPEAGSTIEDCLYKLEKTVVRRWLLDEGKRVDGRDLYEIRPLAAEVGILPRTHGSGMFTRGQTQVLTVATLGTVGDQQLLDGITEEETKRYMHHYNFPSYSVGEARPSRSPGRREIGHGALAERALEPVIPSEEEFPYCIRLVSEVLSSNGSTSQGSVCGSTLALMDAGVPIKAPVAGISCGLVTEGDRELVFTDIQGVEDFFGDMDFKVAGTKNGITAIQMDLKIDGLTPTIIKEALRQTREARFKILDQVMLPCISGPRDEISKFAPKMLQMTIDVDKIREVIGKGGSVIQKIQGDTGAKIDIEDDGHVFISAVNRDACDAAYKIVSAIVKDPEIGEEFYGKVTRLMTFGAFVEFAPGKEGLVHISKLENYRVARVEDSVNVGDMTWVKLIEIDDKGRMNFSRKDTSHYVSKKDQND